MTSIGFFDTAAQADESTRFAASWLSEQKLEKVLPNAPKITSGDVVVHKTRELVQANRLQAGQSYGEGPHSRALSAFRARRARVARRGWA